MRRRLIPFSFLLRPCIAAAAALTALCTVSLSAQSLGVRTNLLYDLTTTPNLSLEAKLGRKMSLSATVGYNPFNLPNLNGEEINPKLRHWLVMPELKLWNCRTFERGFWGIHGIYSRYNIGGLPITPDMKDYRYDGWAAGGGVSYGWQWSVGRHWGVETSLGAGYVYLRYDRYRCAACGKKAGSFARHYYGPTKAEVSLSYYLR